MHQVVCWPNALLFFFIRRDAQVTHLRLEGFRVRLRSGLLHLKDTGLLDVADALQRRATEP